MARVFITSLLFFTAGLAIASAVTVNKVVTSKHLEALVNGDGIFEGIESKGVGKDPVQHLSDTLSNPQTLKKCFSNYQKKHNKTNPATPLRTATFKANLIKIAQHNAQARAGGSTFEQGVNQFTDMTAAEALSKSGGYKPHPHKKNRTTTGMTVGVQAPSSVDWRNYNLVTPVKNQGGCGSCVLFSATGCLEGYYSLAHGQNLVSFSEQELLDCDNGANYPGNAGCNGNGFPDTFKYILDVGDATEADYPYTGQQGTCQAGNYQQEGQIEGYWSVTANDEEALRQAVGTRGPVSVAIHASDSFMSYTSGIYQGPCDGARNHAVLIVGYGTDNGMDYWLVKNQWGTGWGEEGYIRMQRGVNLCLITTDAVSCNSNLVIQIG